ncbi:O-antigen ligase family protein [Candidatus Shapirobacteria bacterium]|nr:O-antigen ligase family protein [Candidatus Shapirobacteria bacterium]
MSYYFMWSFIVVILIVNLANVYLDDFSQLYQQIIYISLAYSTVFLIQKFGLIHLSVKSYGDNFISQIWGHSYLGNFLIFPIIILLSRLKQAKPKNYLLLAFFILALLLTNSRSAFVGLIIGTFFIQFPFKKTFYLVSLSCLAWLLYQSNIPGQNYKNLSGSRPQYFHQAMIGFRQAPLFGNGPNTFDIINRQHLQYGETGANTSHNSVLDFLTNNGLIFTSIIVFLVISGLVFQFNHHRLLFCLGLASFSSSLIDSFWSNFGLLSLSLIFILYQHPLLYSPILKPKTKSTMFLFCLSVILFLFFLSKTISDFLFFSGNYSTSLKFDPFNLNSRLISINSNLPTTLKLFKNESTVYQKLIGQNPTSSTTPYFLKLISLDPQNNLPIFLKLNQYATATKNIEVFHRLDNLNLPLDPTRIPEYYSVQLSINYYNFAVFLWEQKQFTESIDFLIKATKFSPDYSNFQVTLANAYWHNNQKDLAFATLEKCSLSPSSHSHCSTYLKDHLSLDYELPNDPVWIQASNSIPIPPEQKP